MKKLIAALAAAAALTVVGIAGADPMRYGAADDWPKFHPCGDIWWTSADDIGYRDVRMTIQWDAATVGEDASYTATLTKVAGPKCGAAKKIATLSGLARASYKPGLNFRARKPFAAGYYQFTVLLKAATNPARTTTLVSRTFRIGAPKQKVTSKPKPTLQPGPTKKPRPAPTINKTK